MSANLTSDTVDVLIVGAGISGIAAAYYLKTRCPQLSWTIVEGRDAIGGTWDFFRYPGLRSDSDMFTLGYRFRPWRGQDAIADGASILQYLKDTAREFGIDRRIRFNQRVRRVSWSSDEALWTVDIERGGEELQIRCNFLFRCTGYYRYDGGYTPGWPGMDQFSGRVVHPQAWGGRGQEADRGDPDYAGKRVIVIGSGATAVTIAPALARTAKQLTAPAVAQLCRQQARPRRPGRSAARPPAGAAGEVAGAMEKDPLRHLLLSQGAGPSGRDAGDDSGWHPRHHGTGL